MNSAIIYFVNFFTFFIFFLSLWTSEESEKTQYRGRVVVPYVQFSTELHAWLFKFFKKYTSFLPTANFTGSGNKTRVSLGDKPSKIESQCPI